MNVLITGVTGFAGTSLVRYFTARGGVQIFGSTRNSSNATGLFQPGTVTFLPDVTSASLNAHKIDAVIHLAGIAHDLSNQYGPDDYYRVNDRNTRALYDEFRASNAKRFVFVSSIKAVADVASTPIDETAIPTPQTDYGKSKLQAEQYIQGAAIGSEKRFYILRPCMIHGPGNKGNLNLLYKFVKKGLPYPLGAFSNKRSFLSVDNFIFVVANVLSGDVPSGIFHLSDNGFLSTPELVKIIGEALNKKTIILKVPTGLMVLAFTLLGRRRMLTKLSEDMMVSNAKITAAMGAEMPVAMVDGITKTIRSFNE